MNNLLDNREKLASVSCLKEDRSGRLSSDTGMSAEQATSNVEGVNTGSEGDEMRGEIADLGLSDKGKRDEESEEDEEKEEQGIFTPMSIWQKERHHNHRTFVGVSPLPAHRSSEPLLLAMKESHFTQLSLSTQGSSIKGKAAMKGTSSLTGTSMSTLMMMKALLARPTNKQSIPKTSLSYLLRYREHHVDGTPGHIDDVMQREQHYGTPSMDLYTPPGSSMENHPKDIIWLGDHGMVVRTGVPTFFKDNRNELEDYVLHIRKMAEVPLAEKTNDDIVVLSSKTPPDILIEKIRECTGRYTPVLVRGQESAFFKIDDSLSEPKRIENFLQNHLISLDREVCVHDLVAKNNGKDEPALKMLHDFVATISGEERPEFVLDLPLSKVIGLPQVYAPLDDIESAIANTNSLFPELVDTKDKAWALLHRANTFTCWHHDADGKVTGIN
ncbi:hypothetical protein K435DRAFT_864530 [Dendrothele bispora CBS 962.96]|uniref:Uncharacterized protein n=1 Tax=Dendrothele bispora (strain CBS 962.96) TaxID=1314807 RepID=A0A4S8LLN1_DENBC|nr:hypothetical protein K435DRAFT_864530 [Dendrothele bispora CBS 962.96]